MPTFKLSPPWLGLLLLSLALESTPGKALPACSGDQAMLGCRLRIPVYKELELPRWWSYLSGPVLGIYIHGTFFLMVIPHVHRDGPNREVLASTQGHTAMGGLGWRATTSSP